MKNKQVKQMMCDVFNGKWYDFYGLRLYVSAGYFGDSPCSVELYKNVSIEASEIKK